MKNTTSVTPIVKLVNPYAGYLSGYLMRIEETDSGRMYWLAFGFPSGHQVAFEAAELRMNTA